jgi:hypothetical protein
LLNDPNTGITGSPVGNRDNLVQLSEAAKAATLSTNVLQNKPTFIRFLFAPGITGEISEQTVHLARESAVGFICAGHHATERYGVQALGSAIEKEFGIRVDFVDIDNPV